MGELGLNSETQVDDEEEEAARAATYCYHRHSQDGNLRGCITKTFTFISPINFLLISGHVPNLWYKSPKISRPILHIMILASVAVARASLERRRDAHQGSCISQPKFQEWKISVNNKSKSNEGEITPLIHLPLCAAFRSLSPYIQSKSHQTVPRRTHFDHMSRDCSSIELFPRGYIWRYPLQCECLTLINSGLLIPIDDVWFNDKSFKDVKQSDIVQQFNKCNQIYVFMFSDGVCRTVS